MCSIRIYFQVNFGLTERKIYEIVAVSFGAGRNLVFTGYFFVPFEFYH